MANLKVTGTGAKNAFRFTTDFGGSFAITPFLGEKVQLEDEYLPPGKRMGQGSIHRHKRDADIFLGQRNYFTDAHGHQVPFLCQRQKKHSIHNRSFELLQPPT